MLPQHKPCQVVSLGIRKYLVTLRYARETLNFAILSDEAQTQEKAVAIALARVGDGYLGDVHLGDLIEAPIVQADSEAARDAAGITDVGYPASYGELSWEWYDAASLLPNQGCRECGSPLSAGQRLNGRLCDLHEDLIRPKHGGGRPPTPLSLLEKQAELVRRHGLKEAAKTLNVKYGTLKRNMHKARAYGIPTKFYPQIKRAA